MILCLDVGNSHIFGGVFSDEQLLLTFRYSTKQQAATSDQMGVFLKSVLRDNDINSNAIKHIAISSVVPDIDYSLRSACSKYFRVKPFFLHAGVVTGLSYAIEQPTELGADRLATAIAAINQFPQQNIIVVDLGTATTFCAITADKCYLGGVIMPGMRLSMEALQFNTAKLSAVEIIKPTHYVGRTTATNIQAGLYFGQLAAIRQITAGIIQESFADHKPVVIGTGGFAHLFRDEQVFDSLQSDLVLHGIRFAWLLNHR
ncbi:MAG: type III pantothenate kinase [Gammaproteobacteria bacterium]